MYRVIFIDCRPSWVVTATVKISPPEGLTNCSVCEGLDWWAWRRGASCGTILMDLRAKLSQTCCLITPPPHSQHGSTREKGPPVALLEKADELGAKQGMCNGCPLFAFAFRGGQLEALSTFTQVDTAVTNTDFVWVHLDLSDAATQAWLHCRPWPPDIIEMVAAPIQRGKLFTKEEMIYGHLRDFRDEADAAALQAGSLCLAASKKMLITGRRIPLLSIEELRRRVEAQTVVLAGPFGLITEFFIALNDIGEGLLQKASERLRETESKVLKRDGARLRENILKMRRDSLAIARDMTYKRTAMLELARERPAIFPADEFDRLNQQIHRYAALVEDAQEYAEQCQFLLEELRAQIDEETNRNLYVLTMFSAIFLPATLIASVWGMNVAGIPFSGSPNGFWVVGGFIAAGFALAAMVLFWFRFF